MQRILIHEKIYDEVKTMIVEATKCLRIGNPLLEDTDVGPMINQGEAERVEGLVKKAIESGTTVLTGGKREGSVYYPTIFENVSPQEKIARNEIFGPAMLLFRIRSLEEAIAMCNSVSYGLQAGVFTGNITHCSEMHR